MIETISGNRVAANNVTAAASVSAMPVANAIGAITAINIAGGKESRAARLRGPIDNLEMMMGPSKRVNNVDSPMTNIAPSIKGSTVHIEHCPFPIEAASAVM